MSDSGSTLNHSTTSLIAVLIVVGIFLSIGLRVCIVRRRRGSVSTTSFVTPQRQEIPMNPRLNTLRQPDRNVGPARFYQPSSDTPLVQPPPYPSPNPRPSYPLNSAVTEPPFLSITPPPEPQPIHHDNTDITLGLVQRMRKVQAMMEEIQRLENESRNGINHRQRIQELQQRVIELSDTTPATTTTDAPRQEGSDIPPTNLPGSTGVGRTTEPPPAYVR